MSGDSIRISDFGESKLTEIQSNSTGIKGTSLYLPPELLFLNEDAKIIASPAHDIWSLGIIVHQIFADGQHPFKIPNSEISWRQNVIDRNYFINYQKIQKGSSIDLVIQGNFSKTYSTK